MKNLPERIALILYHMILRISPQTRNRNQISLELIHGGEDRQRLHEAFYVKKLKLGVLVVMGGVFLASMMQLQAHQKRNLTERDLTREEFDGKDRELNLTAKSDVGSSEVTVILRTRTLAGEELEAYYEEFQERLPELIRGTNPDLQHVSEDLILSDEYEGYPFEVEWRSSEPEVIRAGTGRVTKVSEKTAVTLTARISYGEEIRMTEISVLVTIPERAPEDALAERILEELAACEQETRPEAVLELPENVEGREVSWTRSVKNRSGVVLAGSLVVAVLIYFLSDRDLEQELEKRRDRIRRRYPDVVWMLALYMGAGLGARGAFRRMTDEYEERKARGEPDDPAYEEIRRTCHELSMGLGERECYETLGKRSGLQEYIRLCSLLSQNLSKGDSKLLARLREETAAASRVRVQNCRKAADEAGTKLLVPMVLLLLIVMVMVMTPAFAAQSL
jgi:hypothetical protein